MPKARIKDKSLCAYCHILLTNDNKKIYEYKLKKGLSLEEATGRYCIDCSKKRSLGRGKLSKIHICPHCNKKFKRYTIEIEECSRECTFMRLIEIDKNECWNWKKNYQFRIGKRWIKFQKAALELFLKIPANNKQAIYEKCKNKKCCNIQHLEIVSREELTYKQLQDGTRKVKLNLSQINEIKEKALWGSTKRELSKEYKVCQDTIYHILNNKTWQFHKSSNEINFINKAQDSNCINCQKEHDNTESEYCSPLCMQEFLLK